MSTCNPFLELQEELGYVQCSFCATILLVSVPCSSLLKVVTVKCGHCTALLSVSLVRASFVPLQLLASLGDDEPSVFPGEKQVVGDTASTTHDSKNAGEAECIPTITLVNKPPEKRQRAPSAYNHFIKEEIKRIKAREPNITHKEAFSTAAKNWAQFPRFQQKGEGESCSRREGKDSKDAHGDDPVAARPDTYKSSIQS